MFLTLYHVVKSMELLSFDIPAETDIVRRPHLSWETNPRPPAQEMQNLELTHQ